MDTYFLKKIIIPAYILFFLLLILVPIIGIEVKGAKRWLDLYFFRLQPIEILKPFFILTIVKILTLHNFQNSNIKYLFSFCLLISEVIILLIDQPDLGQTILITEFPDSYSVCFRSSIFYIFSFFAIFVAFIGGLFIFTTRKFGYIINRLITFLIHRKEIVFSHQKRWRL